MSDPGAADMLGAGVHAAGWGSGFGATFLALRWLLLWLTGRFDRRQALLDEQEARADAEWKEIREEMKGELAELRRRDEQRERENQGLRLAFEIVANIVRRTDADNPELHRAEQLLEAGFHLDVMTPRDMTAALAKID